MNKNESKIDTWNTRTARKVIQLAIWTGSWVATMALASFGPELIWHSNQLITIITIVINLGLGVGMIVANIRHLRVLDEMMQRIQLEAMGLALGTGVVGGLSYALLEQSNLITLDAKIGHLVILMALTYLIATIGGLRKYR
ncbi:hypothetical protein [Spirochaeta lutea]|uniref:Uncharacterized protein n=1 Tax=Spirochaeta lutea TaxID=1480694 RepID=A0A098QX91_9SPIO|nr:hypothetical protein [Spirochaeta lutea]KGE72176.1 hypothetical protein DC28_07725 [Spirochaeta lutea]